MLKEIVGVVQDGSKPSPDVPDPNIQPFSLPAGTDLTLRMRVVGQNGTPIVLVGSALALSVVKRPPDGLVFSKATGVLQPTLGPNVVDFTVTALNTKYLAPGVYYFSIWLTSSGGTRNPVVLLSRLNLLPSAN